MIALHNASNNDQIILKAIPRRSDTGSDSRQIPQVIRDPLKSKATYPNLEKLPTYDGAISSNHAEWFSQIDAKIVFSRVPDWYIVSGLPVMLTGAALRWYNARTQESNVPTTWAGWKQAICDHFEGPHWRIYQRERLASYQFPESQPDAQVFCYEFHGMYRVEYPSSSTRDEILTLLDHVEPMLATILQPSLPNFVHFTDFVRAFDNATRYRTPPTHSSSLMPHSKSVEFSSDTRSDPTRPAAPREYPRPLTPGRDDSETVMAQSRRDEKVRPPSKPPVDPRYLDKPTCYRGGIVEHIAPNCPADSKSINAIRVKDDDEESAPSDAESEPRNDDATEIFYVNSIRSEADRANDRNTCPDYGIEDEDDDAPGFSRLTGLLS